MRFGSHRCERGTVYVAVLGISSLVLVLGLGGIASARAIARARTEARDLSGARWAAHSAIEATRYYIEQNSQWRTLRTNGKWMNAARIGGAEVSVEVINPSGTLDRAESDPVNITATALQGRSVHTVSVTLAPQIVPHTCMELPLATGGAITATGATLHASGFTISTNAAFTALLCTINANVEASLTAVGVTVNGTQTSLAPARTFPSADAFSYYLARGTVIPASALPSSGSTRVVAAALLSPTSNPYTSDLNAQGIYIIDAANNAIAIKACRIIGTLVIINPKGAVALQSTIVAEPAVRNYPCIMIQGDASIETTSGTMTESSSTTPNYNPVGSAYPYPNGVTNTTVTDSYISSIDGLVYVSGNVSTSGSPVIGQLVIGGSLTLGGTLTLGYSAEYKNNPPPGFAQVTMRPAMGSRRQVVQ